MYQAIHFDYFTNTCYLRDDIEGWVTFPYKRKFYKIHPNGKYKTLDGKRANLTYQYDKNDPDLYEKDVDINLRILLDIYKEFDDVPTYQNKVYLDIEAEMKGAINLKYCQTAPGKVTAIALYDENADIYYAYVLDEKKNILPQKKDNTIVVPCESESKLFFSFLEKWEEIDPTVLITWNGDNYDIPYLYNRMCKVIGQNQANRISPLHTVKLDEFDSKMPYKIAGVNSLDYMRLYKKFIQKVQPSYALNEIAMEEIKRGKIQYTGSLDRLFKEDINKFIEYNVNDVALIVDIDKKKKFVDLAIMLAHMGHVPYYYVYQSSRLIEGAIMTYLKRRDIISPNKPTTINPDLKKLLQDESEDDDKFAGAYVKDPIPGLYGWNIDEDLTSLYPSLGILLNCGFETFLFKIITLDPWDDTWNLKDMKDKDPSQIVQIENMSGRVKSIQLGKLIKYIEEYEVVISPNGVAFDSKSSSVIVEIMIDWFNNRKKYKDMMKQVGQAGDTKQYEYYDRIQNILKIFLNSIYGVLGLKSFRYTDGKDYLASAITSGGRLTIMKSADYVNELIHNKCEKELKHINDYVIMSDTDSLYIDIRPVLRKYNIDQDNNEQVVEFAKKFAKEVSDKVNSFYKSFTKERFNSKIERLEIKSETIAKSLYVSAAKQYAQFIVDKEGVPIASDNPKAFDFKGLDVMKSSFPKLFREFCQGLIKSILFNKPKNFIDKEILGFREKFKSLPMIEVCKPSGINKELKEYVEHSARTGEIFSHLVKGVQAHLRSAIYYNDLLKFKEQDKTYPIIQTGDKILWMYLKNNPYNINVLGFNRDYPSPEIQSFVEKYMDRETMFDKNLCKKLQKIYDNLGWGVINYNKNVSKFVKFIV